MTERMRRLSTWAGIAGAGLLGGLVVPSGPPGIGLLLVGAAVAAAVAHARPRPATRESTLWAAAALFFLAMAAVLDAPWLVAMDLGAAAVCSSFAIVGVATWKSLLSAPFVVSFRSFGVPRAVVHAIPWSGERARRALPAGRGVVLAGLLLACFGGLFASADAAFAHLAGEILSPDVDMALVPARIFVTLAVVAGAGGLVLAGTRETAGEATWNFMWGPAPERRRLAPAEWWIPLAVLDLLFATFVAVQITVLFGGHGHVLTSAGLTYANYARSGFFQLVAIAVLTLGVVAFSIRKADAAGREPLLKGLLGALCVLTLVVLASALRRLDLYEDAFGLTRLRVTVYATIFWLGGLFLLVMAAGLRGGAAWLPRTVAVYSVAAFMVFNLASPDALIARRSVERYLATGQIDTHYLSGLSADAVPELVELPSGIRPCVLAPIESRLRSSPRVWSSFNGSRDRALEILARNRSEVPCSQFP